MLDILKILFLIVYQIILSISLGVILSKNYVTSNSWGDLIGMIVGVFLGFFISVSTIIIYLLRKLKVKKRFLVVTPIIILIIIFTLLWLLAFLGFINIYNYIMIFIITNLFITYLYYESKKLRAKYKNH